MGCVVREEVIKETSKGLSFLSWWWYGGMAWSVGIMAWWCVPSSLFSPIFLCFFSLLFFNISSTENIAMLMYTWWWWHKVCRQGIDIKVGLTWKYGGGDGGCGWSVAFFCCFSSLFCVRGGEEAKEGEREETRHTRGKREASRNT